MKNINNYRTFESKIRNINLSNLDTWSPNQDGKGMSEEDKLISNTSISEMRKNGTPLYNWIKEKGYTIYIEDGEKRKGVLDHIGMDGKSFTFYLKGSWNEENYIDHISNNTVELERVMSILSIDQSDLPIYGNPLDHYMTVIVNGKDYGEFEFSDFDIEEISLMKSKKVKFEIKEYNSSEDDFPFWGSKIPYYKQSPSFDHVDHDLVAEMGLRVCHSFLKSFIPSFFKNNYMESYCLERDIFYKYNDELIKFLNFRNINISKNEDLSLLQDTCYNIYQAAKLFDMNHNEVLNPISKDLVVEFLKLS